MNRYLLRSRRLLPGLAVATALCVMLPPSRAAAQHDTSVRVGSSAVVDITVRDGRLIVRGVDGTSGTVRGDHRRFELRTTGTTMSMNPRDDSDSRSRSQRDDDLLEVDVPRGVRLVIRGTSADIDIRDLSGSVDAFTSSGTLRIDQVRGRVNAATLTGDISVTGESSGLRVTTVSGDLRLREVRGEVDVHTTSGDVSISGAPIDRLTVESISGDVRMDGLLARDAWVRITAHSGDVTLRLPDDARGELTMSSYSGELQSAVPLTLMPGEVSRARSGRHTRRYQLGSGGPLQIDLSTLNGDIRLVRSPAR
ncbi:DUF4097 family beta strand repeat-containing protein [Gemmatimonas sp. UBA7669]|uniref:DUF4097 family beta strand repeat-containing protein n=1 Tax=Gemmatimonas sp. UBA7669 TaxID=1946568 RepID=UPI0025BFF9E2|nr:DUF4097 family beta strand repeat-containing protein [Gemmatimonas sp. UBA7669]